MAQDPRHTEALLVLRAQTGDREATQSLLRATQAWLLPYLENLTRDHELAADACQESLVIIWKRLRHLHEPRAYRAWAYRIATRHAWKHLRKRRRDLPLDAIPPDPAPEARSFTDEDRALLQREISRLSPNTRAVVLLHYHAGMTISQTAAVLEISPGTAKSRLNAALTALRNSPRLSEHAP